MPECHVTCVALLTFYAFFALMICGKGDANRALNLYQYELTWFGNKFPRRRGLAGFANILRVAILRPLQPEYRPPCSKYALSFWRHPPGDCVLGCDSRRLQLVCVRTCVPLVSAFAKRQVSDKQPEPCHAERVCHSVKGVQGFQLPLPV